MSQNKHFCLLGGGGFIGTRLASQLLKDGFKVTSIDNSEESIFWSKLQFDKYKSNFCGVVGDVCNAADFRSFIETADACVFLAASKHVDLAEHNPLHANRLNVIGLEACAEIARNTCENFVLMSTDKSAYPTNVMGATKLIGERIILNKASSNTSTKYNIVRLGNVLLSHGSILKVFEKKLTEKAPLPIRGETTTRFLMTVADALDLIKLATEETSRGAIYAKNMISARIVDLAHAYLKHQKIDTFDLRSSSLRAGEKAHELIFTPSEATNLSLISAGSVLKWHPSSGSINGSIDLKLLDSATKPVSTIDQLEELIRLAYIEENRHEFFARF